MKGHREQGVLGGAAGGGGSASMPSPPSERSTGLQTQQEDLRARVAEAEPGQKPRRHPESRVKSNLGWACKGPEMWWGKAYRDPRAQATPLPVPSPQGVPRSLEVPSSATECLVVGCVGACEDWAEEGCGQTAALPI